MSPAEKLLDAARKDDPTRSCGCARSGHALVSYFRPERRYDVGTAAQSFKIGFRAEVLPYLTALLAGCVTREACEEWIHRDEEVTL